MFQLKFFIVTTEDIIFFSTDNDYKVCLQNIQRNYSDLIRILNLDELQADLYKYSVITIDEKRCITHKFNKEGRNNAATYFLDDMIIPSLQIRMIVKFKGFVEVLSWSDKQEYCEMAKRLSKYI